MEFKLPQRYEISNKSTYGRVLNIAGSDYMSGAAYLSSISALKMGCGYCFLCTSNDSRMAVAAKTSNVVFVKANKLKEYIDTADVISIGCGLGKDSYARTLYSKFLKYTNVHTPIVMDADALNLISDDSMKFINKQFKNVIFTPHPKEAARLLNVDDVTNNIEEAAKLITEKYNCITVLKTHKTYIYSPNGRNYTNITGNNALAKAGSGDVLTGIISGLVAQKMDLFEASCLGVYLHGLCGDIQKERLTEYSVMAEDLISTIPDAIKFYTNN